MEIKKSSSANLENQWGQRFLMGIVMAVALLFIGLEYSVEPDDPLSDEYFLARLDDEMELPPLLQQENELKLAPKVEPTPQIQIVVVEDEEEEALPKEENPLETEAGSDMEALVDENTLEPPPPPDEEAVSLRVVEEMPQFPGGPVELMKWLTRNLNYPKMIEEQRLQGRVVAEFIVNKDGSVTDVNIVSSFCPQCDAEVLRVLRMMPRWTAGIDKGEPCRTKVCIPVVFKL